MPLIDTSKTMPNAVSMLRVSIVDPAKGDGRYRNTTSSLRGSMPLCALLERTMQDVRYRNACGRQSTDARSHLSCK